MIRILFVCLGNICRSPMAEGIFNKLLINSQLTDKITCDSAGTSAYHLGELPDERMRKTASQHGITLTHRARQLTGNDFQAFDYLLAMDRANVATIGKHLDWQPVYQSKLVLMRSYEHTAPEIDVPDPYFGSITGFEQVYQMLWKANEGLLEFLIKQHQSEISTTGNGQYL